MKRIFAFFIVVLITLSGCQKQPEVIDKTTKPSWVFNPNLQGKIGAIGVAARTYDQKISSQRKLAISRALDELSMQQGVKVEMNMKKQDTLMNNRSSTNMQSNSNYKTSSTITAEIKSVWNDPITGELYVWMVIK